jgi:hypothetical protein
MVIVLHCPTLSSNAPYFLLYLMPDNFIIKGKKIIIMFLMFEYYNIIIIGMSRYQKKADSPIQYIGADIKK